MDRSEKVTITNMCMIYDNDKVLVQNKKDDYKGITFPGGHVEKGESLTDKAIDLWNNKILGLKEQSYKEH